MDSFNIYEVGILKCRYNFCKNGNEVEKENSIKVGNSYYCKECYEEKSTKKMIEDYYLSNMPSCTIQILRRVIKQLVNEKNISARYVLFVLKFIKNNNKPINNPFGLLNYCNDNRLYLEWLKKESNKEYKNIKNDIENNIEKTEVKFTYKPNVNRWLKILK